MQLFCSQKFPHAAAENFLLLQTGQRLREVPVLTVLLLPKYKQNQETATSVAFLKVTLATTPLCIMTGQTGEDDFFFPLQC